MLCYGPLFPFHQGRFQGIESPGIKASFTRVSIPPRKVSRGMGSSSCSIPYRVSIPPRKVSRPQGLHQPRDVLAVFPFHQGRFQGERTLSFCVVSQSFHSTKEGFKVAKIASKNSKVLVFPFHQGRFQGPEPGRRRPVPTGVSIPPRKVSRKPPCQRGFPYADSVSIPPRKVSRPLCQKYSRRPSLRFPFHQGRFQGERDTRSLESSSCFHSTKEGFKGDGTFQRTSWRIGFHSTKEGFKARPKTSKKESNRKFPFHQGRFQGCPLCGRELVEIVFPFHQGRFQGSDHGPEVCGCPEFPFHQGRFQGCTQPFTHQDSAYVSIPPRKVSRPLRGDLDEFPAIGFHSTKEGFKVARLSQNHIRLEEFPFHQGRFQGIKSHRVFFKKICFHSTKEGFKAKAHRKKECQRKVSIPPRKVSRHSASSLRVAALVGFHSTKEGFKASPIFNPWTSSGSFHSTKEGFKGPGRDYLQCRQAEFPFHQGRFQGRADVSSPSAATRVSIPPRKVSRGKDRIEKQQGAGVSIPPRKVSRRTCGRGHGIFRTVSIPPRKVSRRIP